SGQCATSTYLVLPGPLSALRRAGWHLRLIWRSRCPLKRRRPRPPPATAGRGGILAATSGTVGARSKPISQQMGNSPRTTSYAQDVASLALVLALPLLFQTRPIQTE